MNKEYRELLNDFTKKISNVKNKQFSNRQLATKVLYKILCDINNELSPLNERNSAEIESPEIKKIYEEVSTYDLNKHDLKEWNSITLDTFKSDSKINLELYRLIIKLLDLNISDSLLHVNAIDECFLYEAVNTVKKSSSPTRLKTMFIPDNDFTSDIIEMRLNLADMIFSNIDQFSKIVKLKPNKIFISANYDEFDKDYYHHKNCESIWQTIINLSRKLSNDFKIIVLVPNTFLSRSSDEAHRKTLIEEGLVEGVISLPLRYYTNSLSTNASLLIISKGNTEVKLLDVANLFELSEIKSAGLENITNYIFENITGGYCKKVQFKDLLKKNSNLLISNIVTKETYAGISSRVKLSEVATIRKGFKGTRTAFYELETDSADSGYCILTSSDINEGSINYESLINIVDGRKYDKYVLNDGDVVLTNKSSKVKIAVVHTEDKKIIATGSMLIITPKKDLLNSIYLKMFFESTKGRRILNKIQKGSITNTLTIEDLEAIYISCPDIEVQKAKVENYKQLQIEYDSIKKQIESLQLEIQKVFEEF